MQLPSEPTLLQTALAVAQTADDVEQTWAFLVFCGLVESRVHDEFVRLANEFADVVPLSEGLLDAATRRAELIDHGQVLAARLWQYFQVGRSLMPELELGVDADAGTQPGISSVES